MVYAHMPMPFEIRMKLSGFQMVLSLDRFINNNKIIYL